MDLVSQADIAFREGFGVEPIHFFHAPGRVNLIGEHTDYNDGFVLPCAINFGTVIAARSSEDDRIRVIAADYEAQRDSFTLNGDIASHSQYQWANYIRGTIKEILDAGHTLRGMDIAISGNVPQGAGLSSSAALEVAVGVACNDLNELSLSQTEIALIGQRAENNFVGTKCGIMDQLVSACGSAGHALLIDCRSLDFRSIALPKEVAVMIVDSNIQRGLVDSEYNTRRRQCEEAARVLGVTALRDIDVATFMARERELDPVVARRARHVVTENDRTQQAAQALTDGDLESLGELMAASHASMRDDFEITVPPIDHLEEIIKTVLGNRGGVRMTGGGFGGCVVALAPNDLVPIITAALARHYQPAAGLDATVYVCTAEDGAGRLTTPTQQLR
jgi:galactokinase